MENTAKIFFDDDTPQWFIALGDRWVGPLSASDVYRKITGGEISWAHFVWKSGQASWTRICDTKAFQSVAPYKPETTLRKEVKEAAKPQVKKSSRSAAPPPAPLDSDDEELPVIASWFLYYNHSQFGPFSKDEILSSIQAGKIHRQVHVWKEGMKKWERLGEIDDFKDPLKYVKADTAAARASARAEQRSAPRAPLIAQIMIAGEDSISAGMCRDISVGGMQVLTDRIPAEVGARIKLNVTPAGGGKSKNFDPFVAHGVVVRILEDGRGFSFRFVRLTDAAKKSIENYIGA